MSEVNLLMVVVAVVAVFFAGLMGYRQGAAS